MRPLGDTPSTLERPLIDRRRFIAGSAVSTLSIALMNACRGGTEAITSTTSSTIPTTTIPPTTTSSTTIPPPPYSTSGWLAAENARAGTSQWRIDAKVPKGGDKVRTGWLEGYADTTSARPGQQVVLRVACDAESWRVEAYRMGWYGGDLGRLVWRSDEVPAQWQLTTDSDRDTKMYRAKWDPSLTFTIDDTWPPGSYLLKLISSADEAHYVPLTVRRDDAWGGLCVVSAVTTWQAYNPWGGCTLYECFEGSGRSTVASFDRPYARTYNWGSCDFLTHELPLIALIEELGLDTNYVTDIDLHTASEGPDDSLDRLLGGRTALLTTGHDEYYSTAMRTTLEKARDRGVNLAFFGANAVYRHIRLEPNEEGLPHRQMPNYRTASSDPMSKSDPKMATVQWRNKPLVRPESALIGVQYFAAGVTGTLSVVTPDHWIFEGTDVRRGSRFKRLIDIEVDGLGPAGVEPETLEVLASSPIEFKDSVYEHAMTYYSTDSGAGVFATGTIGWINALDREAWGDDRTTDFVRSATTNVLREFAAGRAGESHPSRPNADKYRTVVRPAQ
jgi:hypothetical protein